MLTLSRISKAYGTDPLFTDVTLELSPGRRMALIGGNGTGKTTLLEIVVGLEDPDAGQVTRPRDVTIGYLPQDVTDVTEGTVLSHVLAGAGEVRAVGDRLAEVEAALSAEGAESDAERHDALVQEHGRLSDRFSSLGGWSLEADAHRVLSGLGFAPGDGDRPVSELSGGWRVRTALARLLLAKPDVLVLDEPTNHLDLASIAWLEQLLAGYEGSILFVSHDRGFIDGIAERIVEIAGGTATEYVTPPGRELGQFDQFRAQREERITQLMAAKQAQDAELARTEEFIARFRYKATKARQVQSRIKQLEKVDRIELPEDRRIVPRFSFPEPPRSSRVVFELEGVSKGFDGREVLRDVSLVVERGWKVAVVGPNGHGKSTLLRMVTGDLAPDSGTVTLGHNVAHATFSQHQLDDAAEEYGLRPDRTVLAELSSVLTDAHRRMNVRTILGGLGFPGDMSEREIGLCSGGEQTRLALGKLLLSPINLLALDEPTNHLDMQSRDVLEDAVDQWPGTVLLVSHDRHLIDAVATHVVEVVDGRAVLHEGTLEEQSFDWVTTQRNDPGSAIGTGHDTARPDQSAKKQRVEQRRKQAAHRQREEQRKTLERNAKQLRTALRGIEDAVAAAEAQVADLTRQLGEPEAYEDPDKARDLGRQHAVAKDRAASLTAKWEALAEALEATDRAATTG